MSKPLELLIDADMIVHGACVAVEEDVCFEGRYHILWSDWENARNVAEDHIMHLCEHAGTDNYRMVFSCPTYNWRKDLDPTYKLHRKPSRKPLAFWDLREYFEKDPRTVHIPRLEADDVLGIIHTDPTYEYDTILWSGDKDLKQVPGKRLEMEEVVVVPKDAGDRFHMEQTLAGDVTDGYPGCPGVGNARAAKFVAAFEKYERYEYEISRGPRKGTIVDKWEPVPAENMWEVVTSVYEMQGSNASQALHQARLARILQYGEYKNGKVNLWQPD